MRGKVKAYRLLVAAICMAILSPSLFGQEEREYIRKGNKLYKKSEFAGSEGMYRGHRKMHNRQVMRFSTSAMHFTNKRGSAKPPRVHPSARLQRVTH
jgi:hypothetical protein